MSEIIKWLKRYTSKGFCAPPAMANDAEWYPSQTFGMTVGAYVEVYPPRALWLCMKAVQNFLPDSGVDAKLVTARGVVLNDSATNNEMESQKTIIDAYSATGKEIPYKDALTNLIDWRMGTKTAYETAPFVIRGMKHYLKLDGSTEDEIVESMKTYIQTIHPYANWLADVTEGADAETPFDGEPDYIPIN